MSEKYLLKVSIDFGSTNTVMAWRVYEADENGKLTISETLNSVNPVDHIPSIMLFKADNPRNPAVTQDCYGEKAERIIRDSNTPPVVCDNFKQYLYTSAPDSPEFQKGVELTTRFFTCLREKYMVDIYNKLPNYVRKEMKAVLYLSTPVRAAAPHITIMRKIAVEAGFTEVNGINEICTDYDEARCVVRYAMEARKDDMKDILAKAGQPEGAMLLFIDVGGSTMDVSLQNFRIGLDGTETMDPISFWPGADVKYTLGGCQVDQAIKDYLVAEGFANPEYTADKWDNGDSKFRFRVFKEENNDLLGRNESIPKLGRLASVCYDKDEDIYPAKNYNTGTQKINAEVFESRICRAYIDHILEAVRQVFQKNQRPVEGRPPVTPGDVDAIFLAGAGSRLYFISKLLVGEAVRDGQALDPGFAQIKGNHNLLFDNWEDPSQCCALGALVEQEKIISPNYARDHYYVQIRLFEHDDGLIETFRKNPGMLDPKQEKYNDEKGTSYNCRCIYDKKQPLAAKYAMLPARISKRESISYVDRCYFNLAVQMTLFRIDDNGQEIQVGLPYLKTQPRKTGDQLWNVAKTIAGIGFVGVATIPTAVMDGMRSMSGKESHITESMIDAVDNFINPKSQVTLDFGFRCALMENNTLQLEADVKSRYFNMENNQFIMDV